MQRMEEQGLSPLECSSGCESGWTMYLDQSSEKPTSLFEKEAVLSWKNDRFLVGEEGEDEMDPSMVSDASSGPPHFLQDDDDEDHEFCFDGDGCFCSPALICKSGKRRRAERRVEEEDPSSFLDDTASSHVFSFSNNCFNINTNQISSMEDVLDFSMGFSTTHFNGKTALQKHCGFLETSLPLKPTSKAQPVFREESKNKIW
ncbi:protein SOB FIVE-LIKE 5-like [Magnolia sinica]|uniref:protein SOB FIVE-LIKE 5-like n=1 Tax=Magnolia sinica TaxID=86752 RepID=UPI002659C1D9|nr:protein SOB FIVE-LIKE 5-like [Magnolia sinica]